MATASTVAKIEASDTPKSDSPFIDSVKRLLRNRFAVMGLAIILLNILIAFTAGIISPYTYQEQDRTIANSAPMWVVNLFPIMNAGDVIQVNNQGTLAVEQGDTVAAGDLIVQFEDESRNRYSTVGGFIYVTVNGPNTVVNVSTQTPQIIEFTDETAVLISGRSRVTAGDVVYDDGTTQVTAEFDAVSYLTDGELLLRPLAPDYVTVSENYFMGTDNLGRDLWTRILYGSRVSLAVAFVGPLFATAIGLFMGLMAGYFGGWVDNIIMRIVDVFYAFPTLLLIILFMAFFRSDFFTTEEMVGTLGYQLWRLDQSLGGMLFIFVGIGLTSWLTFARLTRGQVLSVREQDYIMAARAMGAKRRSIMLRHILPNIIGPLVVAETLTIPSYIRYEAFLSFIGLGVNEPLPSWGKMISDGAEAISTYPNQAIFPALALFIIMFAFNFLGDGLRDALDPRMRGVD
jgi:oligopeptide transport system permease protein